MMFATCLATILAIARVLHATMARATRFAMALRDKLHEKLPRVTSALERWVWLRTTYHYFAHLAHLQTAVLEICKPFHWSSSEQLSTHVPILQPFCNTTVFGAKDYGRTIRYLSGGDGGRKFFWDHFPNCLVTKHDLERILRVSRRH